MNTVQLSHYLSELSQAFKNKNQEHKINLSDIKQAYQELSDRYRYQAFRDNDTFGFSNNNQRIAYIQARSPSTFAVLQRLFDVHFKDLQYTQDNKEPYIQSVLDIGAGPGIASFMALHFFPYAHLTLIEQDVGFASVVPLILHAFQNRLTKILEDSTSQSKINHNHAGIKTVESKVLEQPERQAPCSIAQDAHNTLFPSCDLTILSYILSEMELPKALELYRKTLVATNKRCLVILPGTPKGFKLLLQLRNISIDKNFKIIGPCPHSQKCPMASDLDHKTVDNHTLPAKSYVSLNTHINRKQSTYTKSMSTILDSETKELPWCHFRQFVERSSVHQSIKAGSVGFEEEPYCYLLVERQSVPVTSTTSLSALDFSDENPLCVNEPQEGYYRIVQTPKPRTGHIYLETCTFNGELQSIIFSKKNKDKYKQAKELKWGDQFSL